MTSSSSSLLRRPVIVSAVHVSAPIALPPSGNSSRTALRIVARGRGWLRVRANRQTTWSRFCSGDIDVVALVEPAPLLHVEFRSLVGRVVVDVTLHAVLKSAPAVPALVDVDLTRLRAEASIAVPDLRPPGLKIHVGVP